MDRSYIHSAPSERGQLTAAASVGPPCLQFLTLCCDSIAENTTSGPVEKGANHLRAALNAATPISSTRRSVAIVETVSALRAGLHINEFKALSPTLPWKPSLRSDDNGQEMALTSFNEVLNLGDITCGLMLVGAGFQYPEHQHEPNELYLVLSGGAKWRFGGAQDYCELDAGATIYNKPWDWHGVKAGNLPSLSLYVLWPDLDGT